MSAPEPPPEVRRGLAGVVADTTAVSEQDGPAARLTYRGYPVQDLARTCGYEEVAHLLLVGELPGTADLHAFRRRERALRPLPAGARAALDAMPRDAHPLDVLRTVRSAAGARGAGDPRAAPAAAEGAESDAALALVARTPVVVAACARRLAGREPLDPDPDRPLADDLLRMCRGTPAHPDEVRALEMSLILYAELGFNASTFTARTVVSTGADLTAAVVAALAALGGPLHGGANEEVWRTMRAIGDPAGADAWLRAEVDAGRRAIGFGHRVFRREDPRAAPMREALAALAARCGDDGARALAMHDALVASMARAKGIPPNVDLAAGPAYALLGMPTALFSALFAVGRTAGWCAHALEQRAHNRIVHPLAAYVGPPPREVPR
ncbi:MAG: citrate/2-methylcitrate synthase [Miltoncostaeaceae bacterium]